MSNNYCVSHLEKDREYLEQILPSKSSTLYDLRLLVVDDNDDCLDMVRFIFEEYQAQIKTAISADEAIEAIEEWKPDILLSDISMPNKDGYSLIRSIRIKEDSTGEFLPAVAFTSYVYPEDRTKAFESGFQEVICKPFDPDELVATVAKIAQETLL